MLLFSSAYNEYTVISKEYTGPLDFDITGVDCIYTRAQRLLGRFTTCLAQTTTAKRLLFVSTRDFVPRKCEKNWKFSILNYFKNSVPSL